MATVKKASGRTTPKKDSRITSAKDWKSSARTPVELELPSGNICLAINKGMKVFLEQGKVPNSLLEIVNDAVEGASGKAKKKISEAVEDKNLLADFVELMDTILVSCVMDPLIMPVPRNEDGTYNEDEKHPDLLYADDVDLEDKMFVFQWCVGGTKDVERFRKEYNAALEDVSGGQRVAEATE